MRLAEIHPHDRRRHASEIVMANGSVACCDQSLVELTRAMCRARLEQR